VKQNVNYFDSGIALGSLFFFAGFVLYPWAVGVVVLIKRFLNG